VGRWLTADARDVVAVVPRRSPEAHAPSGGLATSVERWRQAFARTRWLVVVRRALLCAVALAAVLLAAGVPTGVVVGAPLFAGVAVALWAAARSRVDGARAAWLLDRRLGLREQVGTAWELREDAPGPLAPQVVARGAALAGDAGVRYRARPRRARGEWAALGVACAAVVALALIGSGGSSPGSPGPRAAVGGGAGAAAPGRAGTPGATTAAPTATAPLGATTTPGTATTGAPPSTATTPSGGAARAGAVAGTIAVRQRSATAGPGRGGSSGPAGGRGARAGGRGTARTGASATGQAPTPATTPGSRRIGGIGVQGRSTRVGTAGGEAGTATQAAPGASAGRQGTRGAGRQAGQLGAGDGRRSATGDRALPLRNRVSGGGQGRANAGRAGTGGRGRGTGRVQNGGAGAAPTGGAVELPFVPTIANTPVPSSGPVVSTYFQPR
jgi:hypothetical protein